jgi:DnaK suppressor protein
MTATAEVVQKKSGTSNRSERLLAELEKELRAKRDELRAHLRRHQSEVADRSGVLIPDDMGALATEDFLQDMTREALERERQLLREVEAALARMETGEYGICESCGEEISPRRLQALPWARYCLRCAEQMQNRSSSEAGS